MTVRLLTLPICQQWPKMAFLSVPTPHTIDKNGPVCVCLCVSVCLFVSSFMVEPFDVGSQNLQVTGIDLDDILDKFDGQCQVKGQGHQVNKHDFLDCVI